MAFENILSNLRYFNAAKWNIVAELLNVNADEITSINTERLFNKGTDSEGKRLTNKNASYPVYSESYTKRKKRLGLYNGHVNLFLSGEYLGAYKLKADSTNVDIFIEPGNADLDEVLRSLYGENIQGLTQNEWDEVIEKFVLPALLDQILKIFL